MVKEAASIIPATMTASSVAIMNSGRIFGDG